MLTTANRTGFEPTANALWISKDVEAQLIYTFDWSQWLENSDTIASTQYSITARSNDPDPITIEDEGVAAGNVKTYVELANGVSGKSYSVTCKVTTSNGLIDRRTFKVQVQARSA